MSLEVKKDKMLSEREHSIAFSREAYQNYRSTYGQLPEEGLPKEVLKERIGKLFARVQNLQKIMDEYHVRLPAVDPEKEWSLNTTKRSLSLERIRYSSDDPKIYVTEHIGIGSVFNYTHVDYNLNWYIEEHDNERAMRIAEQAIDKVLSPTEKAFGITAS